MAENGKVTWPQIAMAVAMMATLGGGFLGWGEIRQQLMNQSDDIEELAEGIKQLGGSVAILATQASVNSSQLASRRAELNDNRDSVRQLEVETAREREKLEAVVKRIDDVLNKGIFGQAEIIRRLDRILNDPAQYNERGR